MFAPASNDEIHWLLIILVLVGTPLFFIIILESKLNNYVSTHIELDETGIEQDASEQKVIHNDLLRFSSGKIVDERLLVTTFCHVSLAMLGWIAVTRRGSILAIAAVMYCAISFFSGWSSVYLYRKVDNINWTQCFIVTTLIFRVPASFFLIWVNTPVAIVHDSTSALSVRTLFAVLGIFIIISFPLTLMGGKMAEAYGNGTFNALNEITQVGLDISTNLLLYYSRPYQIFVAGFVPFSAICFQSYLIFAPTWTHFIYGLIGLLFVAFIVFACTFVRKRTVLYFESTYRDHKWWSLTTYINRRSHEQGTEIEQRIETTQVSSSAQSCTPTNQQSDLASSGSMSHESPIDLASSSGHLPVPIEYDTVSSSYDTGLDEIVESYPDFVPVISRDYEWMGRSVESLIFGHLSRAPLLQPMDNLTNFIDVTDDLLDICRRRSTASTFASRRRSTASTVSYVGLRSSLSRHAVQGGTLAPYYSVLMRQQQQQQHFTRRTNVVDRGYNSSSPEEWEQHNIRRNSIARASLGHLMATSDFAYSLGSDINISPPAQLGKRGPNIVLKVMAREMTGKTFFPRGLPESQRLNLVGGNSLFNMLDKPAAGMASEVAFLATAIDNGDWTEASTIVTRLAMRLGGNQSSTSVQNPRQLIPNDPNLPPTAPQFYAGGGRLGLERDAFILAGGVQVFMRLFREKSFVGQEMSHSYDARDLSTELVENRLAPCWNEVLTILRELVDAIPSLVDDGSISDDGDFLPFLFTLLYHDSCFDGAVVLIEEILSCMVQSQSQSKNADSEDIPSGRDETGQLVQAPIRSNPASLFFLGSVPDLYELWNAFSCRQLASFCRILALLVFEPEDRQLLESPSILKSVELLQLRRNRAAQAGQDSTVDMNQAIVLGDELLIARLLKLVSIMNFAPPIQHFSSSHVMSHFPFIADALVMLGLKELDDWDEVDRQESLARRLLDEIDQAGNKDTPELMLCELGAVGDMLEELAGTLSSRQQQNQLEQVIHVLAAANQAGIIVGRNDGRRGSRRVRRAQRRDTENESLDSVARNMQALSVLFSLPATDATNPFQDADPIDQDSLRPGNSRLFHSRHTIRTPEDASNNLQFNGLLLGPYQVEVLFVLCTLLGGRRKFDAQDMLSEFGIVSVMEGMFQRLPWNKNQSQGHDISSSEILPSQQPHGPGCECTPESALCVQYLRIVHNFCDRDSDNYEGRCLLLSKDEYRYVFGGSRDMNQELKPGLFSKIVKAFIQESDESLYRFWLASCIESYLRGSSPVEQLFAAKSGLLNHLVEEVTSNRLHCVGSLQTSFDLLGELCKGNSEVVSLVIGDLDEEKFRSIMSVATANLVDSNVFIRSLLLSMERISASQGCLALHLDSASTSSVSWSMQRGVSSCSYLTHCWWDTSAYSLLDDDKDNDKNEHEEEDKLSSDWFPPCELVSVLSANANTALPQFTLELDDHHVGDFEWVFTPCGGNLTQATFLPNTVERLSWFLAANQTRLLRELLLAIDLRNINHENICCLNTAVIIAVLAHRRKQLTSLLQELRAMNMGEKATTCRILKASLEDNDIVDRALVQAMLYLDLDNRQEAHTRFASSSNSTVDEGMQLIGDRSDVLRNFREVLWFWTEYYSHRGRDRLSLEFSSHIRFNEWNHVVNLLTADDGSQTALVRGPVWLPVSPYQRTARVAGYPIRGQ